MVDSSGVFLASLLDRLAAVLGVECALISEIQDRSQLAASTTVVHVHGKTAENFRYDVAGTLFQEVLDHGFRCIEADVQVRFPGDRLLSKLGAESFAGIPLKDAGGGIIGVMAVIDDRSIRDTELVSTTLELYAAAVASELTRTRTETENEQKQQRLSIINALLNISIQDLPLHEKLQHALDEILTIPWLPVKPKGCIFLTEGRSSALSMIAQRGFPRCVARKCARVDFGTCICGRAAASREVMFVDCVDDRHEITFAGMLQHGHYAVPILIRDRVEGVVNLYLRAGHRDSPGEREFLEAVVNTLAGVIEYSHKNEALRRQATIIDQIHDSVISTDMEARVTSCNRAAERLLGYDQEELRGRNVSMLYLPEDHGFLEDEVIAPLKRQGSHELTVRLQTKTGSVLFAHLSLAMQRDDQGREIGMIGYYVDVTGQKLAEEALRASESRFRSLVETTSDWIWETDGHGAYTYVSPRVKELLGYEPYEVMGKHRYDLMPDHEAARFAGVFEPIIARREPFAGLEYVARHKNGQLVVLESSGIPVFDVYRAFTGYRGIDRDITLRKAAEEKEHSLLQKNRELTNQLISVQERELKNIARELHDELGQSLTAIRTDAAVMTRRLGNGEEESARRAANSIISMTDHILDVINSMQRRLRPPALDALGLIDALKSLVESWNRQQRSVSCQLDITGDLSELGEELNITLYRIVQECLTNAARHSGASRVMVSLTRCGEGLEPGLCTDTVTLIVQDNGRGVNIPKALEEAGNFGLFGIRERIEGLGGEVTFHSAPGEGLRIDATLLIRDVGSIDTE